MSTHPDADTAMMEAIHRIDQPTYVVEDLIRSDGIAILYGAVEEVQDRLNRTLTSAELTSLVNEIAADLVKVEATTIIKKPSDTASFAAPEPQDEPSPLPDDDGLEDFPAPLPLPASASQPVAHEEAASLEETALQRIELHLMRWRNGEMSSLDAVAEIRQVLGEGITSDSVAAAV